MFEPSNPAHARALDRLATDPIVWLTTVTADGRPRSTPVWFWWDGTGFLLYSQEGKPKLRSLAVDPHVSLHLEGDGVGGDNVIVEGEARVDPEGPSADMVDPYVEKYRDRMARLGWSPGEFARLYRVAIRVQPTHVRVW